MKIQSSIYTNLLYSFFLLSGFSGFWNYAMNSWPTSATKSCLEWWRRRAISNLSPSCKPNLRSCKECHLLPDTLKLNKKTPSIGKSEQKRKKLNTWDFNYFVTFWYSPDFFMYYNITFDFCHCLRFSFLYLNSEIFFFYVCTWIMKYFLCKYQNAI